MTNGTWMSTEEFNKRSELSNMFLIISGGYIKKRMYVVMVTGDSVNHNEAYSVYILPSIDPRISINKSICYSDAEFMNKWMFITVSTEGILTLAWNDTIYFEGIKF